MSFGDALAIPMTDWPHEGCNFGGAAVDPLAEGRSYHLPRLVAATIGSSLRSGSVLGAQTLVSGPGALDVTNVASLELVSWRLVMIERAGQAQPESSVLSFAAAHDRPHTVGRRWRDHEGLHRAHGRDRLKGGANPETEPSPSRRVRAQLQGTRSRRVTRDTMRCAPAAGDSRSQPILRGESSRRSWRVLRLPVQAGEIVPGFVRQLATKGAHNILSDRLAVNALPWARLAATLMLERSLHKLDTLRFHS